MINDSVLFYYSETKRERDVYKTEKELYYLYPLLIAILPYKPMVHLLNPPPFRPTKNEITLAWKPPRIFAVDILIWFRIHQPLIKHIVF